MPKMGFRADGDENVYVYLESKSGSAICGVDAADNNRLKISASTSVGLNPDSASPMIVFDPRTGGTVGEGDITLLPKGLAGSGNVSIDSGGLVVASLNAGVAQTDSLGFFSSTNGTNGQILVGGGAAPVWANITSTGATVTVSNGANTINLEASATTPLSFPTDSGTAIPAANALTIAGGTGCSTSGAAATVTVNLDATVPLSFPADSGTATPAANALTIAGGTGCSTSGSGATLTVNLDATIPLSFPTDSGTATPALNALTVVGAGGITTSGSGATLTITGSGGGFTWNNVTGTSASMAVNNGYSANNAALVTLTLPGTAVFGSIIEVTSGVSGTGLWKIAQNSGQTIHFGNVNTTTGVGGYLQATAQYDSVRLLCNKADTDFVVLPGTQGNITYV